jgi:hypothetical protein
MIYQTNFSRFHSSQEKGLVYEIFKGLESKTSAYILLGSWGLKDVIKMSLFLIIGCLQR